jgi:hypothetical protein
MLSIVGRGLAGVIALPKPMPGSQGYRYEYDGDRE